MDPSKRLCLLSFYGEAWGVGARYAGSRGTPSPAGARAAGAAWAGRAPQTARAPPRRAGPSWPAGRWPARSRAPRRLPGISGRPPWRGLTTATGSPAAARAAATGPSYPPVASSTSSAGAPGVPARRRAIRAACPASVFGVVHRAPVGRTAMSSVSLATSIPTQLSPTLRVCAPLWDCSAPPWPRLADASARALGQLFGRALASAWRPPLHDGLETPGRSVYHTGSSRDDVQRRTYKGIKPRI